MSPLDSKEIKPVTPKGNQPWIFIGRTDMHLKLQYFGHLKSWLIGKDPDAGKDGRQEKKEMTDDEMVGWYHWPNRHEWSNSERQWRTGKPGMLQSMGSQSRTWLSVWTTICIQISPPPFFWPHHRACGILVPWPRMETSHLAMEAQSHNH